MKREACNAWMAKRVDSLVATQHRMAAAPSDHSRLAVLICLMIRRRQSSIMSSGSLSPRACGAAIRERGRGRSNAVSEGTRLPRAFSGEEDAWSRPRGEGL